MLKIRNPNDPKLIEPKYEPDHLYYLFVFGQVGLSRKWDQGYPYSIPLEAYLSYQTLFGDSLHEYEILVLQQMDSAYIGAVIEIRG